MKKERAETKRYVPGEFVQAGIYWNRKKALDFAFIAEEGGELPGEVAGTYRKIHPLVLMGVGPFIGLGFVVFLPVAVPAVLAYQGWKVVARRLGEQVAEVTEPGHQPVR